MGALKSIRSLMRKLGEKPETAYALLRILSLIDDLIDLTLQVKCKRTRRADPRQVGGCARLHEIDLLVLQAGRRLLVIEVWSDVERIESCRQQPIPLCAVRSSSCLVGSIGRRACKHIPDQTIDRKSFAILQSIVSVGNSSSVNFLYLVLWRR